MYSSQFKSTGLKDVLSFYSNPTTSSASTMASTAIATPIKDATTTTAPVVVNNENTTPKKNLNNNHFSNGPLTEVKNLSSISSSADQNSSSDDNDIDEEKNLKVLHGSSPTSSPNFKGPKSKTLKFKRVKSIVNHLPAIKSMDDVVKLQEEITENRDKISVLQQQLSTVQKEKTSIEEEKSNLLLQLSQLEEKQKSTEEREMETKNKLVESEIKLNETVESLHLEISNLKGQLSILQSKNQESLLQLELIQNETNEKSKQILSDKLLIEKFESDLKHSEQSNQEINTTLENTVDILKNVSKDLFFSTCLSIKLNLLMISKPCNLSTQDLWEQAESQQISTSNYAKWITLKFQNDSMPPQSPIKSIYTNKTTTTTTTTTTASTSPKRNGKKK